MKKEQYFRYYIGQKIRWVGGVTHTETLTPDKLAFLDGYHSYDHWDLLLRPLSSITEEEAKELFLIANASFKEVYPDLCLHVFPNEVKRVSKYGTGVRVTMTNGKEDAWLGDELLSLSSFTPAQFHFLLSKGFDLFGILNDAK